MLPSRLAVCRSCAERQCGAVLLPRSPARQQQALRDCPAAGEWLLVHEAQWRVNTARPCNAMGWRETRIRSSNDFLKRIPSSIWSGRSCSRRECRPCGSWASASSPSTPQSQSTPRAEKDVTCMCTESAGCGISSAFGPWCGCH